MLSRLEMLVPLNAREWRIGITVILLVAMTIWAIGAAMGWLFAIALLAAIVVGALAALYWHESELATHALITILLLTLVVGIVSAILAWGIWAGLMLILAWGIRLISI